MPTVRERVLRDLRDGTIDGTSPLTSVLSIGPYLERRMRHSLGATHSLTVADVWTGTQRRTNGGVVRLLRRALQNERANQCVATRVKGGADGRQKRYHTADINERGYEAVTALLEYNERNATHGRLPLRLPARSQASKGCGCRSLRTCARGSCRLSDDGRACVPSHPRARGFVGVVPHQAQREGLDERHRVRRASRMRVGDVLRRDPDSSRDLRRRHKRTMTYDAAGANLWRRPSTRVRYNR